MAAVAFWRAGLVLKSLWGRVRLGAEGQVQVEEEA